MADVAVIKRTEFGQKGGRGSAIWRGTGVAATALAGSIAISRWLARSTQQRALLSGGSAENPSALLAPPLVGLASWILWTALSRGRGGPHAYGALAGVAVGEAFACSAASPFSLVVERGIRLRVRSFSGDREAVRDVILDDVYRLTTASLPADARIIDVGAHIGTFSALAASQFPQARVLAYEMDPENFALLRENTACFPGVEPHMAAVIGIMQPTGYVGGTGNYRPVGVPGKRPISETVKLGDVVASLGHVDFLKIDVEGWEFDILRAAAADGVLASVDRIAGEWHEHDEPWVNLRDILRDAGFVIEERSMGGGFGIFHAWRGSW